MRPLDVLRRSVSGRRAARPGSFLPTEPILDSSVRQDEDLTALWRGLAAYRRRLWLRRIVRRSWIAVAVVALAELGLVIAARLRPIESELAVAAGIPVIAIAALLVVAARIRPGVAETAIAVDAEGRIGDRLGSALAFAGVPDDVPPDADADAETRLAFVRRQRRDAARQLGRLRPDLFKPRFDRRPALVALAAVALAVPAALLPNPQDAVIARDQSVRAAAQTEARRVDEIAKRLEARGAASTDPRTRLSEELRSLAERLRSKPDEFDLNLAQLGAIEGDVRAQLDPGNEQRAASLASLARSLSRTASGNSNKNSGGDPKETQQDLRNLAGRVEQLSPEQRQQIAQQLAQLQAQADQAGGEVGSALRDAAQSLGQGDTQGAKTALERLGQALQTSQQRVETTRDLSAAASQLQDARRNLAQAGQQNQGTSAQAGQQGQGQQGQQGQNGAGQSGRPGASGQGQQGQGQQGQGQQGQGQQGQGQQGQGQQGQGQQGQGQQGQGQQGQSQGGSPGASGQGQGQGQGRGQGQGQGQGRGQGQGQGQGQGAVGGGGSNAQSLGQGQTNAGSIRAPSLPNRPAEVGKDLSSVYAPFDRVGKPGDPSYVSGTGGDGQTQQGNTQGQGSNNGATVPYQQVFNDFYDYALTTLDRSYVPLSVKDYVRQYFTSLNPSN